MRTTIGTCFCTFVLLVSAVERVSAEQTKPPYPAPTSFVAFRFANASEEIAMARSAAPDSISKDAEILTLGSEGYETAAKGKNGFVCLVELSWAKPFSDSEFWDPKVRAPLCVNAAAARSVLPVYLERTRWVLAGVSKDEILVRTRLGIVAKTIPDPEPGAMSYMMSKQGHITDQAGHWYSHVMFFMPHSDGATWGANASGAPVFSADDDAQPLTTFFVLVPKWSDGSPVVAGNH